MPLNLVIQRSVLFITLSVALVIVYILFSNHSQKVFNLIDLSTIPSGYLEDNPIIYRYHNDTANNLSIRTDSNEAEKSYLHVEFDNPPFYNGLGIARRAAVPTNASLHLRLRCTGVISHIQVDITDDSLVSSPEESNEGFLRFIQPPLDTWQDYHLPLSSFQQNTHLDPNTKKDGILNANSISSVAFTIPPGTQAELDVQTVEFIWEQGFRFHLLPLLAILFLGFYLLKRAADSLQAEQDTSSTYHSALANQITYLIVTLSYLTGLWEVSGEIHNSNKVLYFLFYGFIFVDEITNFQWTQYSFYSLRYAILLFITFGFGASLPVLSTFLLCMAAYIPAVLYSSRVLIPLVFTFHASGVLLSLFYSQESFFHEAYPSNEFPLLFIQVIAVSLIREYIHNYGFRKASQKTESLYQELFEHTSDGIYTVDVQNRLQNVNRGFAELVGLNREQLRNRNLLDIISPLHQVSLLFERQNRQPGESLVAEIHFQHSNGETRMVLLREQGLYENQTLVGYQGLATNITERHKAEENLRQRELLYRNAIEIAGAVPYYQNYQTENYEFVGDNIEKLTGYTPEEFTPEIWSSMVKNSVLVGELKDLPIKEAAKKVRTRKDMNWVCEYLIATRSGEEKWLFNVAVQVHDVESRAIGSLGILMDITERKQLEEALRRESLTFQYIYDGLILFDHAGHILDWNSAAEKMFGYSKNEAQNLHIEGLYKDTEEFHFNWALESISQKGSWRGIVTFLHKGGREGICETVIVPICDQQNETIALFSINHDITERCRAEQERIALEEKLQQSQKMESLGRLAGGIAHDFNNLLTAIRGYTDLLGLKLGEFPDCLKDLEQIRKASERASDLTRQLLVFSRRQIIDLIVLDLNDRVRDMEKLLRRMIGEDIEFITHLWAEETYIKADPGQIEMVLMNLIVNARDAMPIGGKLTLETSSIVIDEALSKPTLDILPGRYVLLTIRDTGIGISADILPHIFEPFFTTKEIGKGTGLGLSSVYGIVSQCKGHIVVDSQLGRGTAFHLYLPCADSSVSRSVSHPNGSEQSNGTESILLVEDEVSVRTLVRKILESRGYHVLEAENPGNALEICSSNKKPDLLLTDVVMPQMSGRELSEQLHELHPDLKVLFMSGYTDDTILKHGISGKGIPFLQKPFTANTLLDKIRSILDR